MRLISLSIARGGETIREIEFKLGLNLILDKPTQTLIKSGNDLGKTTVLRLIDYCLGSDGSDIWEDSEFKTINQEVFNYLHGATPVTIILKVADHTNYEHEFQRTFFQNKKYPEIPFSVNGNVFKTQKEYQAEVKNILFRTNAKKPGLRQLAPKFVRSSSVRMSNTLKFLGDFAREVDYEATHLFLFGFRDVQVLEERPRLTLRKKSIERDLVALTRVRKEGQIEQLLIHLRNEISKLENDSKLHGEVPEISARANTVSRIRSEAAQVAATMAEVNAEIGNIKLTISELAADYSSIDSRVVESIYREANRFIPDLHHEWKDVTDFVANLRSRKQGYLQSQADAMQDDANSLMSKLVELQIQESFEIKAVAVSPAFLESLELRTELQERLKRLGSLEQDLQDIRSLREQLFQVDTALDNTKKRVEEEKSALSARVAVFNKYFSQLSETLYDEQYLLHFEETKNGSISFQLAAVGANVGSGKKMSQTAAFDMAYMQFIHEAGISYPNFVCHDGLEAIHSNQLVSLLSIADKIDGQFIVATLRDKLPTVSSEFIIANTVLELSSDDKLFRM